MPNPEVKGYTWLYAIFVPSRFYVHLQRTQKSEPFLSYRHLWKHSLATVQLYVQLHNPSLPRDLLPNRYCLLHFVLVQWNRILAQAWPFNPVKQGENNIWGSVSLSCDYCLHPQALTITLLLSRIALLAWILLLLWWITLLLGWSLICILLLTILWVSCKMIARKKRTTEDTYFHQIFFLLRCTANNTRTKWKCNIDFKNWTKQRKLKPNRRNSAKQTAVKANFAKLNCSIFSISAKRALHLLEHHSHKIMTMLNKIKKKTKLRTATRAQTSYTRSASCFLTAL